MRAISHLLIALSLLLVGCTANVRQFVDETPTSKHIFLTMGGTDVANIYREVAAGLASKGYKVDRYLDMHKSQTAAPYMVGFKHSTGPRLGQHWFVVDVFEFRAGGLEPKNIGSTTFSSAGTELIPTFTSGLADEIVSAVDGIWQEAGG